MPSPFPGMDPYLEDPHRWPGIHTSLIVASAELLNKQLRPHYYTEIEERVYISDDDDSGRAAIIPDLRPGVIIKLLDDEIHDRFLTVVERESRQVVTVIEVLSPTNKIAGSQGRELYTKLRTDILQPDKSWVEIDLLREGEPVIVREQYPECEYIVHISRKSNRPNAHVWPIRLQQRLPVIPIPLKNGDPNAELDLQHALELAYDRGAYDLKIDYTKEPVPPLTPAFAKWANKLLKQKKLR